MAPASTREKRCVARTHAERLVWCTPLRSGVDCTPAELLPDCPKWFPSNHKIPEWGDGGLVWLGGKCYTHVVGRMGFDQSCNKMQTAVGSGGLFDLFWEGARSDKLQLGVLQMQITTSTTAPVKYTVVSFKRVCFIVLDICASFASCK